MPDDWPPKFSFDGPRLMNLFTGERFYESVDAALREAILNAIDACGRRKSAEPDYQREIRVVFDRENQKIEVIDNGDGMARDQLNNLFSKIGATAADIAQDLEAKDYNPVGEFGIGVVSYFQVCDTFEVHTVSSGGDPIALEFSQVMYDMESTAEEIEPKRDSTGTTIVLDIDQNNHYNTLLEKFDHWVRDVPYLAAKELPENREIEQGGRSSHIEPIDIPEDELADWVERAELGPPVDVTVWKVLDGKANVDVLYRGVFVQSKEVPQLWGLEGAIHVDPKEFKPMLNRERFLDEGFTEEITQFLERIHPRILTAALDSMREAIREGESDDWGLRKWVTIWMAVPRSGNYSEVAEMWDEEFRNIRSFFLMEEEDDREITLAELIEMNPDAIYIAPSDISRQPDLIQKAVNLLRASENCIIRGIDRHNSYLKSARFTSSTTSDLLSHFADELPETIKVNESVAKGFVDEQATVAEIYRGNPRVALVQLGQDSSPAVRVGNEFWINIDTDEGQDMVAEVCDRNEGYIGLLSSCQSHAPKQVENLVPLLGNSKGNGPLLGPVKRQHIRGLLE